MPLPFTEGPPGDPSGVSPAGDAFAGIEDYKDLMFRNDIEQVAHHLSSQFLVYSTGAGMGLETDSVGQSTGTLTWS